MKSDEIARRIEQIVGIPDLTETLARRLSPTDLQSLLLAVHRRRSVARQASDVLREYQQNRFVGPAKTRPKSLNSVEAELVNWLGLERHDNAKHGSRV